jgi:hypothetical protein
MEELRLGCEELSVPVDGAREGLGEPVEGYVVEDLVERRVSVGPLVEFLGDPGMC